eukprot:9211066-Pyramimonas_sp.AAC.1
MVEAPEGPRGHETQRVASSGGLTSDRMPVALQCGVSPARRGVRPDNALDAVLSPARRGVGLVTNLDEEGPFDQIDEIFQEEGLVHY